MATINITEKSRKIIKDYYEKTDRSVISILGSGGSFPAADVTKAYVDGSILALQSYNAIQDISIARFDGSINYLTQWRTIHEVSIGKHDTSINYLSVWRTFHETSLGKLDTSTRFLTARQIIHESSLGKLDTSIRNILGGDTTFGGNKTFTNQMIAPSIKNSTYTPGTFGSGYLFGADSECDNLNVRKKLVVPDLEAQRITYVGGKQVISPGGGLAAQSDLSTNATGMYFTTNASVIMFATNDIIISEQVSGKNVHYEAFVVDSISPSESKVYIKKSFLDTSTAVNALTINNGDINSFSWTSAYYTATPNANNQYAQTDLFQAKAGLLDVYQQFTLMSAPGSGTVTTTLVTSGGTTYATLFTADESEYLSKTVGIVVDVSLRIRNTLSTSGVTWGLFKPNMVKTPLDLSINGYQFVQMGNTTNVERQNMIVSSAYSNPNPFQRLFTRINDLNYGTDKIVTSNGPLWDLGVTDASWGFKSQWVDMTVGGRLAGWKFDGSTLTKDTGTAATSSGMSPNDYPLYAGATFVNRATAPTRLSKDGTLITNKIYLKSSTSGKRLELDSSFNRIDFFNSDGENSIDIDNDKDPLGSAGIAIYANGLGNCALFSGYGAYFYDGGTIGTNPITVIGVNYLTDQAVLILKSLPTSTTGLPSGSVWKDANNFLKVVP